jgi:hypothetical protein
VILLLEGHFKEALFFNPLGIILLLIMIIAPVWLMADYLQRNDSLFRFFNYSERLIRRKSFAVPAILLVATNWIWNIYKGL